MGKVHGARLSKATWFENSDEECWVQNQNPLLPQAVCPVSKKKKKKKLLLHSHLLMSQAAYLAVCSPCQNSFSIFSPWHEGQATHLVLVTQGCFPSASKLFSLYQLGTWRIQLSSCSILASHPLREASLLLCPWSNSVVLSNLELTVQNVDMCVSHKQTSQEV